MAARPIASATVSFGLVSVPVQLYAAGETQGSISFNWLDKKSGTRLKQQYVNQEGQKVEKDEMIKGYEIEKGRYLQFTTEEIKALEEKKTQLIEVKEFVPASEVDRVYMDRTYFLGPDKGGDRAYHLLAEALKQTGLAALGQYAARGKQYLVLLRPMGDGLAMEQLHYANEVRSIKEVPLGEKNVKEAELKLAVQLIEQLKSQEFHPEKYRDTVREKILELIEKKRESGQEITADTGEEAPQTRIIDLMEALKASVARGKSAAEPEPSGTEMETVDAEEKAETRKTSRKETTRRKKAS